MNNFDDLNLAVKTLSHQVNMQELFLTRLVGTLIKSDTIQPSDINQIMHTLKSDFPCPPEGMTHERTALNHLCKTISSELPELGIKP